MDPEPKKLETFDFLEWIKELYNGDFIIDSIISGYISMILDREEITITYNPEMTKFDKYVLITSNFETTNIKIYDKDIVMVQEVKLVKYELSSKDLDVFDEYLFKEISKYMEDGNCCFYFDFYGLNINHKFYSKVLEKYKEMIMRFKKLLLREKIHLRVYMGILNISEKKFSQILEGFPIARPNYKTLHTPRVLSKSRSVYYMFRYSAIDFFHDLTKKFFVLDRSRQFMGNLRRNHYSSKDFKLSSYFYYFLKRDKKVFEKFLTQLVMTDIPIFNDCKYSIFSQILRRLLSPRYELSKKMNQEMINDNNSFCSVFHLVKNTKISDHILIERGKRIFCMCNKQDSHIKHIKRGQQLTLILDLIRNVDRGNLHHFNSVSKRILHLLYNGKEKEYWLDASSQLLFDNNAMFKVILKNILGKIGSDLEDKIDFYNNLFILFLNGGTSWVDNIPKEAYENIYLDENKDLRVKQDLSKIIDGFVCIFMSSLNMEEKTTSLLNVDGAIISKMYNVPIENLKVNVKRDDFN